MAYAKVLYKNKGSYDLILEIHDISNVYFYIIVFLLVLLYVFWFQDIKILNKKREN